MPLAQPRTGLRLKTVWSKKHQIKHRPSRQLAKFAARRKGCKEVMSDDAGSAVTVYPHASQLSAALTPQ
jgi:hypothetical protein